MQKSLSSTILLSPLAELPRQHVHVALNVFAIIHLQLLSLPGHPGASPRLSRVPRATSHGTPKATFRKIISRGFFSHAIEPPQRRHRERVSCIDDVGVPHTWLHQAPILRGKRSFHAIFLHASIVLRATTQVNDQLIVYGIAVCSPFVVSAGNVGAPRKPKVWTVLFCRCKTENTLIAVLKEKMDSRGIATEKTKLGVPSCVAYGISHDKAVGIV